jgi:hypothetical protein
VVRTMVIAMLDAEGASAAPGRVESSRSDARVMKVRLLPTSAGISIRLKAGEKEIPQIAGTPATCVQAAVRGRR